MGAQDSFFLLVRDNVNGRTSVRRFIDSGEAFAAYFEEERLHNVAQSAPESADVEVVLISAESEDSVREGYPHYFTRGSREERRADFAARVQRVVMAS
ncbi:hypothetical protein [Cellulomonas sp. Y8]|uniref:hypothetical protein n=1 Tax=Cellulomonas sp. Y8 TaxID=2591145 RepID=UPI003D75877B